MSIIIISVLHCTHAIVYVTRFAINDGPGIASGSGLKTGRGLTEIWTEI